MTEVSIEGVKYSLSKRGQLGQGGTGTVICAISEDKTYAIKKVPLLDEKKKKNKTKNKRFRKEVEYCRHYHSDNIIQIIGAEEIEETGKGGKRTTSLLYVMPYYERDLRKTMDDVNLGINEKINLLLKLYGAVEVIHSDGVIHRDIKPENILIGMDNLPVLADFGIAHFEDFSVTKTKDLLANRLYFAPEQGKGADQTKITAAVDVFAVGLITNEIFTGSIPRGSNFKTISQAEPLLGDLDDLVRRMTYQDSAKRISVSHARLELGRIQQELVNALDDAEKELRELDKECFGGWAEGIDSKTRGIVYHQAAEDMLLANKLVASLKPEDWDQINSNYHCNIRFNPSEDLINASRFAQVLEKCKSKFLYESNIYHSMSGDGKQNLYDDGPSEASRVKLDEWLEKHSFYLSGRISSEALGVRVRKYFVSCSSYHCEELIDAVNMIDKSPFVFGEDEPLFWIAGRIALGICAATYPDATPDELLDDFNLIDHVSISDVEDPILNSYLENHAFARALRKAESVYYRRAKEILDILNEKYSNIESQIEDEQAIVIFDDQEHYNEFKKEAREIARGHYIFEADIDDLFRLPLKVEDKIMHVWNLVFDVTVTLAKVLGLVEVE